MVGKRALGKGLDSMIPNNNSKTANEATDVSRETLININEVEPNKSQPRRSFDEDSLHELAESIKQYGIIQPIIVQRKEKFYEIIAGERRWRAAKIAGLKKVPIIIKDYYTNQEVVEIALIENIQRENLNPIEEALAYQRLIKEFNLKQEEVADKVSKSRAAVTNSMRLLKLGKKVQQMLIDDIISSGHARALLPIEDQEKQYIIANKVLDEKLSVRETENLVKKYLTKEPKQKTKVLENEYLYKDLEEKIKSKMGTKVCINRKENNKGKIEIEYYSADELDRIVDLFLSI